MASAAFLAAGATFAILSRSERTRWREPLADLTAYLRAVRKTGSPPEASDYPRAGSAGGRGPRSPRKVATGGRGPRRFGSPARDPGRPDDP